MNKEEIKQAIRELQEEGYHMGCPWKGSEDRVESLKLFEPLPDGAVKMVTVTWRFLDRLGNQIGDFLAKGLFVLAILVLLLGVYGVGKAVSLCTGWMK